MCASKKEAFCLRRFRGESKQQKLHPTRVHMFWATFCYKTGGGGKSTKNDIYVGCGSGLRPNTCMYVMKNLMVINVYMSLVPWNSPRKTAQAGGRAKRLFRERERVLPQASRKATVPCENPPHDPTLATAMLPRQSEENLLFNKRKGNMRGYWPNSFPLDFLSNAGFSSDFLGRPGVARIE